MSCAKAMNNEKLSSAMCELHPRGFTRSDISAEIAVKVVSTFISLHFPLSCSVPFPLSSFFFLATQSAFYLLPRPFSLPFHNLHRQLKLKEKFVRSAQWNP